MNKYKQLEETTHRNPQQCEQRRKELETRLVPRSQTQSDMDHTLQRLQARAVLSRQKQNDLIETRIKDLQTQSEREKNNCWLKRMQGKPWKARDPMHIRGRFYHRISFF